MLRLVATLLLLCLSVVSRVAVARMHASEIRHLRQLARDMFYHGYHSYMEHAFPWDELKPLSCEGRRWDRRERGDLDDVLGGYALTLVDSLDMLAVLGDRDEFKRAVGLVVDTVHFDRDVTVSVFESTIRVIGGLLSAHLLASPDHHGVLKAEEYSGQLLDLAVDLGRRLLPAFDTPTGIPVHRVHLQRGMLKDAPAITCPAAAGSLLVELSYLSRLSGIEAFEDRARNAVVALWLRRSDLNLLGSSIDVFSGEWQTSHVGIGAGLDSFFEYLLKYHLVSGNSAWLEMFNISYSAVETHMNHDDFHIEVDMYHGRQAIRSRRVSALQAFWPGLQVLAGDVSRAMRSHDKLFLLWNKFGAMPEIFDLSGTESGGIISWARTSPLRPELIESTYHLYQATRDHKYLKIGRKLLEDIERVSRVECGYAAVGNIHTLAVEDRMDSYFLSETVKYLYLLFSEDPDVIVPPMALPAASNITNQSTPSNASMYSRALKSSDVVFSTEGHVLPLDATLFTRDSDRSSLQETLECENGHALVQRERRRQHSGATDAATSLSFVPIGVSIRVGNSHVSTMVASPATFGHQFGRFGHVEAPLLLYNRDIGDACEPLADHYDDIVGRIVMVTRGRCSFAEKALHIQQAGGAGVIVINKKSKSKTQPQGHFVISDDADGAGANVRIPLVMVSREAAAELHRSVRLLIESDEPLDKSEGPHSNGTIKDSEGEGDEGGLHRAEVVVSLSAWLY